MSSQRAARTVDLLEWGAGAAIVGLAVWLRTREFPATWTHLDAVYPYIQGALEARGEPPPLAGAPAAFSLRHGAVNAWLTGPAVWATRDFVDAAQLVAAARGLPVLALWGIGRLMGARWLGLALALGLAVSPLSIQYARSGGGTYFLELLLSGAMLLMVLAARRGPLWSLPAALLVGCLPFCHPMGAPLALGLALGLWGSWRGRGPGMRGALLACLGAAALPYLAAEVATGLAGTSSMLGMLAGELSLAPEGDEGVGVRWSLEILALRAAGPVAGGLALAGTLGGLMMIIPWGRRRLGWRLPAQLGLAGAAVLGLAFLWLLQLRSGYGLEHHPLPFFLPLAGLCLGAAGALGSCESRRRRLAAELIGLAFLAATVLGARSELPKTLERDAEWSPGIMSMGNIEGVAGRIYLDSGDRPLHIALVHSPEVEIGTPLIGVAAALLCWGVDPERLPFTAPPGGAVAGYLIQVGEPGRFQGAGAPGALLDAGMARMDPEVPVRLSRVEDFSELRRWAEALPDGWRSFGPEEYLDTIDYTRNLPVWGGLEEPHVRLVDSPYPFRW